jgi:hypothetical protein
MKLHTVLPIYVSFLSEHSFSAFMFHIIVNQNKTPNSISLYYDTVKYEYG